MRRKIHFRSKVLIAALVAGIVCAVPRPVAAQPPELSLPIDCRVGEDCWLVNLVDRDPGPGRRDFRCGALSYDGHKGTDIAIPNDTRMMAGVAVLAAAPGRVLRVRDGMPHTDTESLQNGAGLQGRDCGNGVIVDHGDGWTTQYCHLSAGTFSVKPGDRVTAGDRLGLVGRSGRSEFPHVHLTLRQGRTVIDPFTGESSIGACRTDAAGPGLWSDAAARALAYPGPQPYHQGFATGVPAVDAMRAGALDEMLFAASAPALVYWVEVFTLEKGDRVTLVLSGPDGGTVAETTNVIDRPLARWHGFVGRKKRGDGWPTGSYEGRISVTRGDREVTRSATAVVK